VLVIRQLGNGMPSKHPDSRPGELDSVSEIR
jgi:hypothetical protein